ncbi:MAG: tetratricopeptide repeat protein [Planctomycetia bacterium]|nr:tetratricopeptide repeat protein [Planctomycetia bacterium]
MKVRWALAVGFSLLPSLALAIDVVKTSDSKSTAGTLQSVTRNEIVIQDTDQKEVKIEVNRIDSIRFHQEPTMMGQARSAVEEGNYDQALKRLANETLDPAKIERLEVKQELEYFKARSLAGAALASGQVKDLREAGTTMIKFLTEYPTTWRYYEAQQVIGDLLLAVGETQKAIDAYKTIEAAPWDDFKMRGAVYRGRAQQQGKQFDAALKTFESALALGAGKKDPLIEAQVLAATVGRAACLAETGNADEAVKIVAEVIESADPENKELHAVAFVTLGNCYVKANKPKEALLEFLKVHLLYNTYPNYHAEALYNLSLLWRQIGKTDRADESLRMLQERYSGSQWAKKGQG